MKKEILVKISVNMMNKFRDFVKENKELNKEKDNRVNKRKEMKEKT
jgi:hypothetical protein